AYMSVREAMKHAALALGVKLHVNWILSTDLEKGKCMDLLESADGVVVPGGFGSRGIEGKINAAHYARTNKVPYFGLCLGMQLMVVEFGREVLNSDKVNSTEFDQTTPNPVIALMPEQEGIIDMGGTMRLGLYPCMLQPGTKAAGAYQTDEVQERHRHRFEFNNHYRQQFAEHGMVFSGISPDGRLVEIAELKDHPFMLGTQFHPEFLSRPNRPHPLFVAFMRAACEKAGIVYQDPPFDFDE
ncbi:CTP synthase, partial [bacterium]|nr:CTP synthase [bacterium]